MKIVPPAE